MNISSGETEEFLNPEVFQLVKCDGKVIPVFY